METREAVLLRFEQRLEKSLGAKGKTWAEKVSSLEQVLPLALIKQLQVLPQQKGDDFLKNQLSIETQLGLFTRVQNQPQNAVWTEEQRSEARAKQDLGVKRLGNSQKTTIATKLTWWLHDTRTAIPKRAYAMSKGWRIPMTIILALLGGVLGWFMAGIGASALGALVLGTLGFILWSENNLAKSMWAQTRLLETLLAVFRGAIVVVGILILLVGASLLAWLIARFWNAR
jgi:hypothetical protein